MKKMYRVFLFLVMLSMYSVQAQNAGTLDLSFNSTGYKVYDKDNIDLYQDVKVQSDGKILALGTSYTPTWSSGIELTRYLTDGSFDPSFGTGGHFEYTANIETGAYKCMIRENGKILIAGYTTDYASWWSLLIQVNADGTLDNTFGTNGVVSLDLSGGEEMFYALCAYPDGGFLASGYYQNTNFQNVPVVVRFDQNGNQSMSFGTNGIATVPVTESDNDFASVAVQSDGKIMAAGHISNGLLWFSLLVARFDQNGQLDPTYGTNGIINMPLGNVDDEFFDMALTPDDQAILTGFLVTQSDLYYHMLLMKFDNGGWPSISFGFGGFQIIGEVPYTFGDALCLQDDGKILVCGSTGQMAPGNNDWAIWRFTDTGFPDGDFGTDGLVTLDFFGNAEEALGIALHSDKIIVAGKTRNASNMLDFAVARFENDTWVGLPEASVVQTVTLYPNPVQTHADLQIQYGLAASQAVDIAIYNGLGQCVMELPQGFKSGGNYTVEVPMTSLKPGLYSVCLKGAGAEVLHHTTFIVVE